MSRAVKAQSARGGRSGLSFVWRVLVPFAVAVLVVAAGATAVATLTTRAAAITQLDARAAAIAHASADRLHGGDSAGYRHRLERGITVDGARLELAAGGAAAPHARTIGSTREVMVPAGRLSGTPVAIRVRLSTAAIDAAAGGAVLRALLLAAALALLLGLALKRLLRHEISLPLMRLAQAVERIRDGAHTARIDVGGPAPLRSLGGGLERLAAAMAELDSQAATDPLTGAANRRFFQTALATELERASRDGAPVALVLLDLDGFKQINDRYGHPFGDGVLQRFTSRLRACLRATDVLARVGGDEFAIVLPGLDSSGALAIVARARAQVGESLAGVEIDWCSGVASYPGDASDPRTLIECADVALYCAKSGDEAPDCAYSPDGGSRRSSDRATIEALLELPDAIVPVFQPVVTLGDAEVAGYEALARFPHPPARRPDEWFAVARCCGLGPALEARALREALAQRSTPPGTFLSINLSAAALVSSEVAAVLPPDLHGIVLEVTGDDGPVDDALVIAQLSLLRSRGARVAIDDGGGDYAALQQVMRLAPDIIKLDRSLIGGLDSDPVKAALVESYVRFARNAGAAICAVGIETPEELRALVEHEIAYGQGFGIGRPGPPWSGVSAWVAAAARHVSPPKPQPQPPSVAGIAEEPQPA